jgi:hypothetical protein
LYSAANYLAQGNYIVLPLAAAELVLSVSYFLLLPWARRGMFATLGITPLLMIIQPSADFPSVGYKFIALGLIVQGLLLWLAYRSPRNKLAFRIEIPAEQLRRVAQRLARANAVRACMYGTLSLGVPLLGIASLALSLTALREHTENEDPVGKKLATVGLVFSCLSTAGWLVVAALVWRATHR